MAGSSGSPNTRLSPLMIQFWPPEAIPERATKDTLGRVSSRLRIEVAFDKTQEGCDLAETLVERHGCA